jgi:TRAP-type C4-dicarboxylate transport system permease small subunit
MFAVMIIVCTDVALRYLFNDPLSWAYDLISLYVMVGLLYLALAPSYSGDHHIRIDLLVRGANASRRLWLGRLQILMVAPVFVVIAWLAAVESYNAYHANRVLSGPIPWPRWPIGALVALGSAMLLLRLSLQWFTGPPRHVPRSEEEL